MLVAQKTIEHKFQSTLSVRRATIGDADIWILEDISIHALRKESDANAVPHRRLDQQFQSTLSVRRATATCNVRSDT